MREEIREVIEVVVKRCSEDPPFGGSPDGVFNFPKTCKEKTSCLINVDRIRPK